MTIFPSVLKVKMLSRFTPEGLEHGGWGRGGCGGAGLGPVKVGRSSPRGFPEKQRAGPQGLSEGGFSILEAIVAIAIIGSALIISSAFLNILVVSADHLEAHIALLHEVEGSLELMRAGLIPLESGSISMKGNSSEGLQGLRLTVLVEREDTPGLFLVTIRAECSFRRRILSRSIVSEIWRP